MSPNTLPVCAGIGLRAPHVDTLISTQPHAGWVEVHSENYFADGGPALTALMAVRDHYPLSLHGVGMGLGSTDPLDETHLARLKRLIDLCEPSAVSEHLCWGAVNGRHFNDLLPVPCTDETLHHLCTRIDQVQEALGRRILVENVSRYLAFRDDEMTEWDFVGEVVRRSGCGLLLDVNNIYVNACNFDFDPHAYLAAMPAHSVEEIHLGGFTQGTGCLIDTHGNPVSEPVWALYAQLVERIGPRPTLIEWDTDLPPLSRLLAERERAQRVLEDKHALPA